MYKILALHTATSSRGSMSTRRSLVIRRASLFVMMLAIAAPFAAATPAMADDCAALGGSLVGSECQVTTGVTVGGGGYTIGSALRITANGSITVTPVAGAQTTLALNVAGNFTIENPSTGITGNGFGTPNIGASIAVVASGDILLDGNGSDTGAQIR